MYDSYVHFSRYEIKYLLWIIFAFVHLVLQLWIVFAVVQYHTIFQCMNNNLPPLQSSVATNLPLCPPSPLIPYCVGGQQRYVFSLLTAGGNPPTPPNFFPFTCPCCPDPPPPTPWDRSRNRAKIKSILLLAAQNLIVKSLRLLECWSWIALLNQSYLRCWLSQTPAYQCTGFMMSPLNSCKEFNLAFRVSYWCHI